MAAHCLYPHPLISNSFSLSTRRASSYQLGVSDNQGQSYRLEVPNWGLIKSYGMDRAWD
ncbi:hypothetical protein PAXRUDRAFT_551482 [Paxillus rubicundulus Ve08.2h10]|uniref:Uncharacterized protein n=1 Tax=Paxillus rubicundulus Ve08.2h10 TaxID=930991 RepID=A0A0D0DUN6_9AGAM|nr:hypothetical protein PAXRUDRAFT_551482 [Paxillus rubicundulus Ve08.2h10]